MAETGAASKSFTLATIVIIGLMAYRNGYKLGYQQGRESVAKPLALPAPATEPLGLPGPVRAFPPVRRVN